jgi:hypothetical protein
MRPDPDVFDRPRADPRRHPLGFPDLQPAGEVVMISAIGFLILLAVVGLALSRPRFR